jgi:hypothetical protein
MQSVAELIKSARMVPARALAIETRQAYPVPWALAPSGPMRMAFLYFPQQLVPSARCAELSAPTYVALLDPDTGVLEELRRISSAELSLTDPPGALVGRYSMPEGMTLEQHQSLEKRMLELYDLLLAAYADGQKSVDRAAAEEFNQLFWQISEPPLLPYYRAAGRSFFEWVERNRV